MRALLAVAFLLAVAPLTLGGCPQCQDGCSDSTDSGPTPTTSVTCVEAAAPGATDPAIVFGEGSGDSFAAFTGTPDRQIDYGDQGGQHFYVTARWYAPPADGVLVLSYDSGSGNHGSQTIFNDPGCTGWLEATTYVQLQQAVDESGTLHGAGGRCAASGCAYDEATDRYVLEETLAEADQAISLTP
jgi:hypothetical protein